MPALINIAIADGAATPVTHTFTPAGIVGVVATWKERIAVGIAKFFPYITGQLKEPTGGSQVYRVKFSIVQPKSVTGTDGVVKEDYRNSANIEYIFNERATEQERKDLRVLVGNSQLNATIISMIEKLEPAY
jgi:hypothetical protein